MAEQIEKNILPERPITTPEAARFLGKSRQTLLIWRKEGLITGYAIKGRIYYKPSELMAALKKVN
jgi:hypothetical protein